MEPLNRRKTRRKLSRQQVIDILERNVALYKDEQQFVHYLVELAVYLMEYEYDWAESGLAPPMQVTTEANPPQPVKEQATPGGTPPPRDNDPNRGNGRNVSSKLQSRTITPGPHTCPYCGNDVGAALICPSCKNLTR